MYTQRNKELNRIRIHVCKHLGIKSNLGWFGTALEILARTNTQSESCRSKSDCKKIVSRYYKDVLGGTPLPPKIETLKKKVPVPSKEPDYKQRAIKFFASDAWKKLRYKALQVCGGACQCCGASQKDGVVLHVDHVKPRYKYPELELSLDNLQVLCSDCNLGKGAWDETDWRTNDQKQQLEHLSEAEASLKSIILTGSGSFLN